MRETSLTHLMCGTHMFGTHTRCRRHGAPTHSVVAIVAAAAAVAGTLFGIHVTRCDDDGCWGCAPMPPALLRRQHDDDDDSAPPRSVAAQHPSSIYTTFPRRAAQRAQRTVSTAHRACRSRATFPESAHEKAAWTARDDVTRAAHPHARRAERRRSASGIAWTSACMCGRASSNAAAWAVASVASPESLASHHPGIIISRLCGAG